MTDPYDFYLERKNDDAIVSFCHIGEGYNGDYDPEDEDDKPLLRVDVLVSERYKFQLWCEDAEPGWVYPDDGSICTGHYVGQDEEYLLSVLDGFLLEAADTAQAGGTFRHLLDRWSWSA